MSSDSSAWTKVGKGGRAVAFPAEAASAFGGRQYRPRGGDSYRSEFPAEASAAFGRSGGGRSELRSELRSEPRFERPARAEFDSAAAAAFGSRPRRSGGEAPSEFDSAAATAFGGGSRSSRRDDDGFPSAFGKKKSVFSEAAAMGFGDGDGAGGYALSALARKRAEAAKSLPPKPQTFEEMFPVLGAPAAPARSGSAVAPGSAPVKRSFADLMRNHIAAEEAEAARVAAEEAEETKRRYQEEIDRAHIRRLHVGRHVTGRGVGAEFVEGHDAEEEVEYGGRDLDHDAYGAARAGVDAHHAPSAAEASESDEEAEAEEGAYTDDLY